MRVTLILSRGSPVRSFTLRRAKLGPRGSAVWCCFAGACPCISAIPASMGNVRILFAASQSLISWPVVDHAVGPGIPPSTPTRRNGRLGRPSPFPGLYSTGTRRYGRSEIDPVAVGIYRPQDGSLPISALLAPDLHLNTPIMATADPYASATKQSSAPSGPLHPASLAPGTLILDPSHHAYAAAPPISSALYSGFIEHLGRGIYGGLVDNPAAPSPAELLEKQDKGDERTKGRAAWRKDVMRLMGKDGELGMPILRWPGGNFVSNYHWQDGIGPVKDRPKVGAEWFVDWPC